MSAPTVRRHDHGAAERRTAVTPFPGEGVGGRAVQ